MVCIFLKIWNFLYLNCSLICHMRLCGYVCTVESSVPTKEIAQLDKSIWSYFGICRKNYTISKAMVAELLYTSAFWNITDTSYYNLETGCCIKWRCSMKLNIDWLKTLKMLFLSILYFCFSFFCVSDFLILYIPNYNIIMVLFVIHFLFLNCLHCVYQ